MYTANTGYAVAQVPGGPVAVPMQTAGGVIAVQAVPQGGQPQMVMIPASGVVGGQPQFVQVPASGATVGTQPHFVQVASPGAAASGYQPQQVDVPPSYGQGQYMPLQDEQVWKKKKRRDQHVGGGSQNCKVTNIATYNGNSIEWSSIRSVIKQVINKIRRPRSGSPICQSLVWLLTELDDTKSCYQLIIATTVSEK